MTGTITLDNVATTDHDGHNQLGGSATYATLAAAEFAPVRLVGAVGYDARAALTKALSGLPVDVTSVETSDLPNFWWRARYDPLSWETLEETYGEGAYSVWHPTMSASAASSPILFLGALRPDLQSEALDQSRAELIGLDSRHAHFVQRHELMSVLTRADLLFLNRSELGALTGRDPTDWREAAMALLGTGRLRAVVVKAGALGAACVWLTGVVELPAEPVSRVVDPTGAGDALAGGFLGACARAHRSDPAFFQTALGQGLACAARAIASRGVSGLVAGPSSG